MEPKDQQIFRTFTFRKFSPTGSPNENFIIPALPIFNQPKLSNKNSNYTLSSDSSEKSEIRDNEFPVNAYKNYQNLDKVLENMIKSFKTTKSIPESSVANLPIESFKIIVEKLLKEKLSLQEELSLKDNFPDSDSESINSQPISPSTKIQAFRALENVSPIEWDDSNGHTNYKIISLALTPKEEINPDHALIKLNKFENYKKEIIKLTNELKELTSYNKILLMIISLDKDNESLQINQYIKNKVEKYTELSATVTEEIKSLKKDIEPKEGFLENVPLQRKEIKILSKMIGFEKKCDIKPSEMDTLNRLLDLYMDNSVKTFQEYVDELLAGHDIAEMAFILIKYIKFLEEEAIIDLNNEALNCFIAEYKNEVKLEDIVDEGLLLDKEQRRLNVEIARINYKKSKNTKLEQIKIREKTQVKEKKKWKLPDSLESLSGPSLYSKTLASLNKKWHIKN